MAQPPHIFETHRTEDLVSVAPELAKQTGARVFHGPNACSTLNSAAMPRSRHDTVMCASGARATIAASVLKRAGFDRVDVFMGSFGAWKATS